MSRKQERDGDLLSKYKVAMEEVSSKMGGIIALKGLPYTWKTPIAHDLGKKLMCPVLCIDDFLGEFYNKIDDYWISSSRPLNSDDDEEDDFERPSQKQAFAMLCAVATRILNHGGFDCVIIKSRLDSTFEVDLLMDLTLRTSRHYKTYPLLIIECSVRNEYKWKQQFRDCFDDCRYDEEEEKGCYRPRSWKVMEKVRGDYDSHTPAWDLHLQRLISAHRYPPPIRRLVVDPIDDLYFVRKAVLGLNQVTDDFIAAVKYLLTSDKEQLNQNPYVVELDELLQSLYEKELSAASLKGRSKYLCPNGRCVFKYCPDVHQDYYEVSCCGACEDHVSEGPVYTCYFCVLTLHKSCAERFDFKALQSNTIYELFGEDYIRNLPEKHACKSCIEKKEDFYKYCGSCLFQTHLKCGLAPTVINHSCHQHFLSIQLDYRNYICKACGFVNRLVHSYGCKKCASYYHLECALSPIVVKHKHGGYEHAMKLMYSCDGMEPEESYWCDFCYQDIDPHHWFYSCQKCPYYIAHLHCAGGYKKTFDNLKDDKFVDQLQSQFEDMIIGDFLSLLAF